MISVSRVAGVAEACAIIAGLALAVSSDVMARVAAVTVSANVAGLEFNAAVPFVDMMRQSRPWSAPSTPWEGMPAAGVDPRTGWPLSDFGVTIDAPAVANQTYSLRAVCGSQPAVQVGPGHCPLANVAWDPSSRVFTADVVSCLNGSLMLTFLNTSTGCQNVSLLLPGFSFANGDETRLNPEYLKLFAPLANQNPPAHLRFMNWLGTNGSPEQTWAQRHTPGWGASYAWGPPCDPLGPPGLNCSDPENKGKCFSDQPDPTHPFWPGKVFGKAVPHEAIIQMANELKIAPWINVPWGACVTDAGCTAYVTALAQLYKAQLHGSLPVYIEYSNEVWNPSFAQCHGQWYDANETVRRGGDPDGLNAFQDGTNEYTWAERLTAYKALLMGRAARAVLGDRARPVLAGQVMGTPQLRGLAWLAEAKGVTPASEFFAVANAPYFTLYPDMSAGPDSRSCAGNLTPDDVLTGLNDTVTTRLTPTRNATGAHQFFSAVSIFYGVKAVSYEGGPDTSCFFNSNSSVPAKIAAHLDPRMRRIVRNFIAGLQGFTGGGFDLSYFVWGIAPWNQFGEWSLAPNVSTWPSAPKKLAIEDALAAPMPAAPSLGVQLPEPFIGANERCMEAWSPRSDGAWSRPFTNDTAWFVVRPPANGASYNLRLNVSLSGQTPGLMQVSVNNGPPTQVHVNATQDPSGHNVRVGPLHVTGPISVLELRALAPGMTGRVGTNLTVHDIGLTNT